MWVYLLERGRRERLHRTVGHYELIASGRLLGMDRARAAEASDAATCTPSVFPEEAEPSGAAERRVRKWRSMLGTGVADWREFVRRHPQKLKRRVRKGCVPLPPSSIRIQQGCLLYAEFVTTLPHLPTRTSLDAPTGELREWIARRT